MNHKTFNSSKIWLTGVTLAVLFTAFGCKKDEVPTLTTSRLTNVGATTVACGGNVTSAGTEAVTERGICWSTSSGAMAGGSHLASTGSSDEFDLVVTELTPGTTYYIRAYATSGAGTGYGNELSFTTKSGNAVVVSVEMAYVYSTSAGSQVSIPTDGGDPITARGMCWSANPGPTVADSHSSNGTGADDFTATCTNLTPNSTYYARAYATNSYGTYYGTELTFTTTSGMVEMTTGYVTFLNTTSILGRGSVTDDGGDPVTERGICWGTSPNPTIAGTHAAAGEGLGSFSATMTDFLPETEYFVRAYATNGLTTFYGADQIITSYGTVTDIDGNEYPVATIGNQKWMAANLKTTHYRNGEPIVYPADGSESWGSNTTGAYAWYNNNISNKEIYGALYNGYAAMNTNGLCPIDWHVPTNIEFEYLFEFIGGTSVAGGKMKTTTTWNLPNVGATNELGFSAVGAGYHWSSYEFLNQSGYFMTTTPSGGSNEIIVFAIGNLSSEIVELANDVRYGISVRCIKD